MSGRPAKSFEKDAVDWIPTQNLSNEVVPEKVDADNISVECEEEGNNGTELNPVVPDNDHSESLECSVVQSYEHFLRDISDNATVESMLNGRHVSEKELRPNELNGIQINEEYVLNLFSRHILFKYSGSISYSY